MYIKTIIILVVLLVGYLGFSIYQDNKPKDYGFHVEEQPSKLINYYAYYIDDDLTDKQKRLRFLGLIIQAASYNSANTKEETEDYKTVVAISDNIFPIEITHMVPNGEILKLRLTKLEDIPVEDVCLDEPVAYNDVIIARYCLLGFSSK